jgi:hypothetical protein
LEKPKKHQKKHFVTNSFKYLLAVSSIAGTLGIWNLLSNKDLVNAETQNNSNTETTTKIDQSSLPTLIPLLKVDLSNVQSIDSTPNNADTTGSNPLREVARPTSAPVISPSLEVVANNTSSNNSGNQSAPVVNPPAPVTTTQSSKP